MCCTLMCAGNTHKEEPDHPQLLPPFYERYAGDCVAPEIPYENTSRNVMRMKLDQSCSRLLRAAIANHRTVSRYSPNQSHRHQHQRQAQNDPNRSLSTRQRHTCSHYTTKSVPSGKCCCRGPRHVACDDEER